MNRIFLLVWGLSALYASNTFGAKIESISNKNVTIYLESIQDENVKAGDIIHLIDGSGKKMAELKILENRGLMAEARVINGVASKTYKVMMPHMISNAPKKTAPVVAKPKPQRPIARPRPRPRPRPVYRAPSPKIAKRPVVKPTPRPRKIVKKSPPKPAPAKKVAKTKPSSQKKSKNKESSSPKKSSVDEDDDYELPEDDIDDSPADIKIARPMMNWNITMDILSLAGIFFEYQVFGFYLERKVAKRISLGVKFNFGSFETNQNQPPIDRPILDRNEIGLFARYKFDNNFYDKGFFIQGWAQSAQETWAPADNFAGASESGVVFGLLVGYQWRFKSLNIRTGYGVQQSTFSQAIEVDGKSYERTSTLLTGMANYAVLQIGFLF